jgi:hypothetical protein
VNLKISLLKLRTRERFLLSLFLSDVEFLAKETYKKEIKIQFEKDVIEFLFTSNLYTKYKNRNSLLELMRKVSGR